MTGSVKRRVAAEDSFVRTDGASPIAAKSGPAPSLWRRPTRAVHPAIATCMLLALTVGVLSGCAGARVSAPTTATVAVTKTSAVAFAHAVNLRASDQPSMEVVAPERAAPMPTASLFALARCDGGISPARILLNLRSTFLSSGGERERRLVISRVTVMPSEALARRNLAAFASARGLRCARRDGDTSISRLDIALPGGTHAVGERIVVPTGTPPHVLGYHDIVGFVFGPAEIVLTAAGFSHPVAARTERELRDVMYRRATEARGEL
jgi:hypothetical protein